MLSRIKGYLVAAAGIAALVFWAVIHFINQGRKLEQADSIQKAEKAEDEIQDRIQAGHYAGNQFDSDGLFDVSKDPHNRANKH